MSNRTWITLLPRIGIRPAIDGRYAAALLLAIFFAPASTLVFSSAQADEQVASPAGRPNFVLILADDMGYGDVKSYNPASKIPTPNLDRLAHSGMRFLDAHSPSAVCTPTRYALLTGRYAWRSELKRGVLWGHSPLLIETDRETIASMLRRAGYQTAAIGKWHLGLGRNEADYYGRLAPGPNALGFDYFYGIPASLDMEPYVYVENEQLDTPLDGKFIGASAHRREGGDGYWRAGQIGTGFSHQEVLPVMAGKAVDFIRDAGESDDAAPFFLYLALPSPHTPWLPDAEYRGVSGAGYYGDFAAQVDGVVGQIDKALSDYGLSANTLFIYTSDNGAHWMPDDIEQFGHAANGGWRGQKADIHEGGHRVPLLARWPGRVTAGVTSDQLTVLTDLMATFASIAGVTLEKGAAPDGLDISDALFSRENAANAGRAVVHHALDGMFAIRIDEWKLIEGLGSGGFTQPSREDPQGQEPSYQLYNMSRDPGEKTNVARKYPEVASRLLAELNAIREREESLDSGCYTCQFEQQAIDVTRQEPERRD